MMSNNPQCATGSQKSLRILLRDGSLALRNMKTSFTVKSSKYSGIITLYIRTNEACNRVFKVNGTGILDSNYLQLTAPLHKYA